MRYFGPSIIILIGLFCIFIGILTFVSTVETEPTTIEAVSMRPGSQHSSTWLRLKGVGLRGDLLVERTEGGRRNRHRNAYLPVVDAASAEWTGLVLSVKSDELLQAAESKDFSGVISTEKLPTEVAATIARGGLSADQARVFHYGGKPLQKSTAAWIALVGLFAAAGGGFWIRKLRAASRSARG